MGTYSQGACALGGCQTTRGPVRSASGARSPSLGCSGRCCWIVEPAGTTPVCRMGWGAQGRQSTPSLVWPELRLEGRGGGQGPRCGHSASSARCRGCQLFIEHAVSPWSLASRPGMTSPGPYQPLSLLPSCPWCLCSCYPGIPWSWCRSCPPISCCWKFLLSRICSKGVSHEALPNS